MISCVSGPGYSSNQPLAVGLRKGEFARVLNVSFFDSVMATLTNDNGYVTFFWSYTF